MHRAVITGFGVVSAVGLGKKPLSEALQTGRSGVSQLTLFDTQGCRCHSGAIVPAATPSIDEIGRSRTEILLTHATAEALADAGFTAGWSRLRIFQGTAHGPLDLWESAINPCAAHPHKLGASLWSSLAERVDITTTTNACVASTWALGLALGAIRRGETDLVLVAGVECLTKFLFCGFDSLRSLTSTQCRPFDRRRDGLVLGEGAAVIVLESATAAIRRQAPIKAELLGFGAASDVHHLTSPDPSGRGLAGALKRVMKDADLKAVPDYINLHGTGTIQNDRMEIAALRRTLGPAAEKIAISGTKAVTGHTSGAAGVIETVICLCLLAEKFIPATVGLEIPDSTFGSMNFIMNDPRPFYGKVLMSLNSAFGGNNAAIVLRSWS